MSSGIYKIQSKVKPERFYIGSAVDLRYRWKVHRRDLRKGSHHSKKLQYHYNKYGISDLIFSVIAICDREELKPIDRIIRPEQFFIWAYNPYFNNCPIAGSRLGTKHTEESKQKMRKPRPLHLRRNIGRHIRTQDERERISISLKGRKQSPEMVAARIKKANETKKIRNNGFFISEETREKMSKSGRGHVAWNRGKTWKMGLPAWNRGIPHSDITRAKISAASMGNKYCVGRVLSQETKSKIRDAQLNYQLRKRNGTL